MHLELQRLASLDSVVCDVVVVDVRALLSGRTHLSAFGDVIDLVAEAVRRSGRTEIWVFAPAAHGEEDLDLPLERSAIDLVAAKGRLVVQATEPLPGLTQAAALAAGSEVSIVTGELGHRMYEVFPLGGGVRSILDVVTGELWAGSTVEGLPAYMWPLFEGILRGVQRHRPTNYAAALKARIADPDVEPAVGGAAALPGDFLGRLDKRWGEIAVLVERLTGVWRADADARMKLAQHIRASMAAAASTTGYVCGRIERLAKGPQLTEICALLPTGWKHATTGTACTALLAELHHAFPDRWFGPALIDLMVTMEQQGLPTPARALDLGWALTALDPEETVEVGALAPVTLGLPAVSQRWLADRERRAPAPDDLVAVAKCLPALDRGLSRTAAAWNVADLLEHDIGATAPVVSRIEARGNRLVVPAGYANAASARSKLTRKFAWCQKKTFHQIGRTDLVHSPLTTVQAIERWMPKMPREESEGLRMSELLQRYSVRVPELGLIHRARSLAWLLSLDAWWAHLESGSDVARGKTFLERTGRLGMRDLPLQMLPRKSPEGHLVRSVLTVDPGFILIGIDFSAFDLRIAAGLSQDPLLLEATKLTEPYTYLAQKFFPSATRICAEQKLAAKIGTLSILNGQTRARFWKAHPELPRAQAEDVYDRAHGVLAGVVRFRNWMQGQIEQSRLATTRGGWRREFGLRETKARMRRMGFSTLVQGLGADILRCVLRELDVLLRPMGAGVVHHAHDEVFVRALLVNADLVEQAVRQLMETVPQRAPFNIRVPMFTKAKRGTTWRDLV